MRNTKFLVKHTSKKKIIKKVNYVRIFPKMLNYLNYPKDPNMMLTNLNYSKYPNYELCFLLVGN